MITIDIPDFGCLGLEHLVLDYNGTLAVDGGLLPGAADAIKRLNTDLQIHVVTADTFGVAAAQLEDLPVALTVLPAEHQDAAKRRFVLDLGAGNVVAIGNGRNDRSMLSAAALGIVVLQAEGAAAEALAGADVVCSSILDALALLENPRRLIATLRS